MSGCLCNAKMRLDFHFLSLRKIDFKSNILNQNPIPKTFLFLFSLLFCTNLPLQTKMHLKFWIYYIPIALIFSRSLFFSFSVWLYNRVKNITALIIFFHYFFVLGILKMKNFSTQEIKYIATLPAIMQQLIVANYCNYCIVLLLLLLLQLFNYRVYVKRNFMINKSVVCATAYIHS